MVKTGPLDNVYAPALRCIDVTLHILWYGVVLCILPNRSILVKPGKEAHAAFQLQFNFKFELKNLYFKVHFAMLILRPTQANFGCLKCEVIHLQNAI